MSKVIEGLSPDEASEVLVNLVKRLDEIVPTDGINLLTRPLAIAVLEAVIEAIRPITKIDQGQIDTGEHVITDHGAVALMDELVDALKDLDTPKKHAALKSVSFGAPSKLKRAEVKRRQALIDLVEVYQRFKNFHHRNRAQREVAKILNQNGNKLDGHSFTAKNLENLRRPLK